MTLQQMINLFRIEAYDENIPPLFDDDSLTVWLNEAQIEAAIRAKLLRENSNPLLTRFDIKPSVMDYPIDHRMFEIVYGDLVYKGSEGMLPYVLAITSAEELDTVRPFWRTLPYRPTAFIHYDSTLRSDTKPDTEYTVHVEGYRLPMWEMGLTSISEVRATGSLTLTGGSSGQVDSVTINGVDVLGSPIPFVNDLTDTAAAIVVQVNLNQNKYVASSVGSVITFTDIAGSGILHNGHLVAMVATDITGTVTPITGGIDAVAGSPEINQIHHRHLVKWALHRGYSRPDSEVFDPEKANRSLKEFEAYFGVRPDAANRKRANASRPHRNAAYY